MKQLPIKSVNVKLLLLSAMHLATDGLCAYLIFARLYPENPKLSFAIFIGYNLLAFVMQAPIGMLIDKAGRPKLFLTLSVALIAFGYLSSGIRMLSVSLLGLGNAFFHVSGGKYVIDKSGNDIVHLGIFVSTGAVGLAFGQGYFKFAAVLHIFWVILILCLLFMLFSKDPENRSAKEVCIFKAGKAKAALLAVVFVVLVRAFVGKAASADFDATQITLLIISMATALGKSFGGIASRFFGTVKTLTFSMVISAFCLTLGTSSPFFYVIGVFAFNFSMPITLYYANTLLKGSEGFAFGTLAAVLVPGYLLAIPLDYGLWIRVLVAALCILCVIIIATVSKVIRNASPAVDPDPAD